MMLVKVETKVLVTGVFDVLHVEHLRFLTEAKNQGDWLMVGVETNLRVKQIKGPNRPINSQDIRQEQLRTIKGVDEVFLLPEKFDCYQDWFEMMLERKPDIYAVSAHTNHMETKRRICAELGIKLVVVRKYNPAYSTSKILDKLRLLE